MVNGGKGRLRATPLADSGRIRKSGASGLLSLDSAQILDLVDSIELLRPDRCCLT